MTKPRHILLTIHGIRTYGRWETAFRNLILNDNRWNEIGEEREFLVYRYGFLSLLSLLVPFLRNRVIKQFRSYLEGLYGSERPTRIDIIAHSYGAYVVLEALSDRSLRNDITVHTLILCGAAVSPSYDLSNMLGPGRRIGRLINDCGTRDGTLLLTLLVPGFRIGMGGRLGLHGLEGPRFQNRYFVLSHSEYFERYPGPRPYSGFMSRWWVPLLFTDIAIKVRDRRPDKPSFFEKLVRIAGENGATITVLFYATILALLFSGISILLHNAANAQQEAYRSRSRFLANTAITETNRGNAVLGSLISLNALPRNNDRPYVAEAERAALLSLYHLQETKLLRSGESIDYLSLSDNAARVTSLSSDGRLQIFNLSNGQKIEQRTAGISRALDSDGKYAFSSRGSIIDVFEIVTGNANHTAQIHNEAGIESEVTLVKVNSKSKFFLTAYHGGEMRLWNFDGTLKATLKHDDNEFYEAVAATFTDSSVIVADAYGVIALWNLSGDKIRSFPPSEKSPGHNSRISNLTTSPDQRFLISTSGQRTGALDSSRADEHLAIVWNINSGKSLRVLDKHTDIVRTAVFSPDGALFATASDDGATNIWNISDVNYRRILVADDKSGVSALVFAQDGRSIYTAHKNGHVHKWDIATQKPVASLAGHNDEVTAIAISKDETFVVSASTDGTVRTWMPEFNYRTMRFLATSYRLRDSHFSLKTNTLVAASDDAMVHLWHIGPPTIHHSIKLDSRVVASVFCGDDGVVGVADQNGTISIYKRDTTSPIYTISLSVRDIRLTCSPNGKALLVLSGQGIHLIDLDRLKTNFLSKGSFSIFDPLLQQVSILGETGATFDLSGQYLFPLHFELHKTQSDSDSSVEQEEISCAPYQSNEITFATNRGALWMGNITITRGLPQNGICAFNNNGTALAISDDNAHGVIVNIKKNSLVNQFNFDEKPSSFALDPSGKLLIAIVANRLSLWRCGAVPCVLVTELNSDDPQTRIENAQFSKDGKFVYAWARNGVARLWRVYPELDELANEILTSTGRCLNADELTRLNIERSSARCNK